MNISQEKGLGLAIILNCSVSSLPIKYLGVPLHCKKLLSSDSGFRVKSCKLHSELRLKVGNKYQLVPDIFFCLFFKHCSAGTETLVDKVQNYKIRFLLVHEILLVLLMNLVDLLI